MIKFRLFIRIMCLCSACVLSGCSEDDGKGDDSAVPPVDELKNAYAFDGVKTGFRSMFYERIGDYDYTFLSSDKVDKYDELHETDERDELVHPLIQLVIKPSLEGKNVDVKTETSYFAFYNMTSSRGEFESVETNETRQVKSGTFTVTADAGKRTVRVEFRFVLPSGKVFEGNCTTDLDPSGNLAVSDAGPQVAQSSEGRFAGIAATSISED